MTRIRAMSASSSTPAILAGPIERPALVKGPGCSGPGWLPGARWRAVAADDLPVEALYLAGAVGVDGQGPAQFVQDHVVVPPAVVLEVGEAGAAAVGAVGDVVGFAAGRRLVAAAGVLAVLIPQRDQPPQVHRDLVGLPDIQREGGAGQGLAEQGPAQDGGGAAGPGGDLQDLAQDPLLHLGQRPGCRGR